MVEDARRWICSSKSTAVSKTYRNVGMMTLLNNLSFVETLLFLCSHKALYRNRKALQILELTSQSKLQSCLIVLPRY